AHVILEEYIPPRAKVPCTPTSPPLIVLSAKNEERLREQVQQLLAWISLLQYPMTDRRNEEDLTPLPATPDAGYSNRIIPNRSSDFALGSVGGEGMGGSLASPPSSRSHTSPLIPDLN